MDISESISMATVVGHAIFLCRSSGSNAKTLASYLPLVEAALVGQAIADPHRDVASLLIDGDDSATV